MSNNSQLISVAVAVPENILLQKDVARAVESAFSMRFSDFGRLSRVFDSAGIVKRHSVKPIEWFLLPRGWAERTQAYLEGAGKLFIDAATRERGYCSRGRPSKRISPLQGW